MGFLRAVPGFLAGMTVTIGLCIATAGRVGRALGSSPLLGAAIVASLGLALSATLTPQREAFVFGASGPGSCDLSRIGLAPLRFLHGLNDVSVNILLFIPLGVSIGLLPRSGRKAALMAAAAALPIAIETTQMLLPLLDRACESADVIDNLTGLVLGLAGGTVAGRLARLL